MKKISGYILIIFIVAITGYIIVSFFSEQVRPYKDIVGFYPQNIDDLIAVSHYIVVGKAESAEQFSVKHDRTYKYTVKVNEYLKGEKYSDRIEVFQSKNAIEVGNEYLLFLSFWESELHPNPNHGPMIEDNTNIKISGNKLIGNPKFINNMSKEEMLDYISNSPYLRLTTIKEYNIKDEAKNLEELINSSDHIIHVKLWDVDTLSKRVSSVGPLIIERYKGERLGVSRLSLPADLKEGEEYLLFLKNRPSPRLTTRNGSVIEKNDTEKWNKVMEKLKEL